MWTYYIKICCVLSTFWIPCSLQKFCQTQPTTTPGGGVKVPEIPQVFTSNLEINIKDKNLTIDAVWYFNQYDNLVALKTTKYGDVTKAIYNYPTNEVFIITDDNKCTVTDLSSRPETAIFGIDSSDGNYHVMSSNYAFKLGKNFGQVYVGQDVVRGIAVDHWRSCSYWPQGMANFTTDYYFTSKTSWNTSTGLISVPVRADVQGVQQNKNGGNPINFHHVYDFFAFKMDIDESDGSVFETPEQVVCPGRKSTQSLPTIPKQFYYRQEIAIPETGLVTSADVWYDESYRLIRVDYRPIASGPPTWNTNPLTEVLDYSFGVKYLIDKVLGNCSISPLVNNSFGTLENATAFKTNKSFVLQMRNPLQLFYIDKKFTYVGQRSCRSLQCDVYSAIRDDFTIEGFDDKVNTTIEFYFLSKYMSSYPNDGFNPTKDVPIKMVVSAYSVGFSQTYNFVDFNDDHPDLSLFDVSRCYSESAKLYFKVRFPGLFKRDTVDIFKLRGRLTIASMMQISPLRIQDVHLDIDFVNIFFHATLLDRSPSTAQFTYIGHRQIEKKEDKMIRNVLTPMLCANLCIDENQFTCNSFDFCVDNGQSSCRLSRYHVGDGTTVLVNSTCDHFSRTVNGPRVPEKSIFDAYSILRQSVYHQKFTITVEDSNQEITTYIATETSIDFGTYTPVVMPSLTGQFSYSQEITIPGLAQVYSSKVWYDTGYKLVRYDYTDSKPIPPFYSTNPMTTIHDFSTGLAYNIDQFYKNCTVTQVNMGTFDAEMDITNQTKYNGYIVQMKNPLQVFHITNNYKFMGQKTVREMLCNVYETVINDFTMPGLNGSYTALVQYFFLAQGWFQVGEHESQLTRQQLIRQEFTILEKALFFVYNYFDFEERHPDLSTFDIRNCFDADQQSNFQIKFQGQFHPYLDVYQKIFLSEAQAQMSSSSNVPVLRFQDLQLTYDENNIYVTGTLLGQEPYLMYFTRIPGHVQPHKTDSAFINTTSASDCASACFQYSAFQCNSFDFCLDSNYCYLSKLHVQDGIVLSNTTVCDHYSRTVTASGSAPVGLWAAYDKLKNSVYEGKFQVRIPTRVSVKIYQAVSIVNTILNPGGTVQGGMILKHFKVAKKNVILMNNDLSLEGVAIDDCAAACDHEVLFDCQSFEYCFSGTCYLSRIHPDENTTLVQQHQFCDLYSRQFLDRFTQLPGTVFKSTALSTLKNVTTANLCAKTCVMNPQCKSFDYCIDDSSCRLLATHKLVANKTDISPYPSCSHFDRRYIDDFRLNAKKDMKSGVERSIAGISPDMCAKLCIDEEGMNCRSFVYCRNITVCKVITVSPRQAPAGSVIDNPACDLYTRMFYPPPDIPPPGRSQTSTPTTVLPTANQKPSSTPIHIHTSSTKFPHVTRYTQNPTSQQGHVIYPSQGPKVEYLIKYVASDNSGALVGVAFGVFLPGLVLGAALLYFVRKYRQKHDSDMHVRFVNTED